MATGDTQATMCAVLTAITNSSIPISNVTNASAVWNQIQPLVPTANITYVQYAIDFMNWASAAPYNMPVTCNCSSSNDDDWFKDLLFYVFRP